MGKKLKIILAAAVLMTLSGCGTAKLDPEDYCNIEIKGADGYAKAYISNSYSDLEKDVAALQDKDKSELEIFGAAVFADLTEFEIVSDKTENLKNGDVLEIEVSYDKEKAKSDYGFVFSKDSFKYKVEGLEEAQPLNPFEDLKIEYIGFSPKAEYKLDTSDCSDIVRSYVEFSCDAETVANGDKLTVKATVKDEQRLLENEGLVLSADSMDYDVSGIVEGKAIDPFEGLVLEYNGIAPNAKVSFNTTGCDDFVRNNVTFSASGNRFANGDNCKVTISYSSGKAEDNGVVFTQEEKSYTVSGVAEYPASDKDIDFSELDNDFKAALESELAKSNAEYYVGGIAHGRSFFTDVYSNDEYTITDIEYKPVKKIYFYAKDASSSNIINNHFVIWEIVMTGEKTGNSDGSTHDDLEVGQTATVTLLADTYIQNFAVNEDGTLNTDEASKIKYDVYYKSAWGARYDKDVLNVTVDSICEKWRASNASSFNIEITDY